MNEPNIIIRVIAAISVLAAIIVGVPLFVVLVTKFFQIFAKLFAI